MLRKLRQFAPLGWVKKQGSDGSWVQTGHVLITDADYGRDCHPWLFLLRNG